MKRITVEMLNAHSACADQLRKFAKVFPKGAPVSMRSLAKAQKAGLDVFFCECLLAGPAWAEYHRVTGQALAEYHRVRWQALAEYERVKGQASAEYERVRGQALIAALAAEEGKHG